MSVQTITEDADSRLIFGVMAFAIGFSLIGNEIKVLHPSSTTKSAPAAGQVVTTAGRIIIGGFFATALLVLISHAGAPGKKLGVGLATVTMLSSALVYGGPVWTGLSNTFSSKPTTPSSDTTTGTGTGATAVTGTFVTPVNPYLQTAVGGAVS